MLSFINSITQSLKSAALFPPARLNPGSHASSFPHLHTHQEQPIQNQSQTPSPTVPTSSKQASPPSHPRPQNGLAIQRRYKCRPNQQPLPQRLDNNPPRPRRHAKSPPPPSLIPAHRSLTPFSHRSPAPTTAPTATPPTKTPPNPSATQPRSPRHTCTPQPANRFYHTSQYPARDRCGCWISALEVGT